MTGAVVIAVASRLVLAVAFVAPPAPTVSVTSVVTVEFGAVSCAVGVKTKAASSAVKVATSGAVRL